MKNFLARRKAIIAILMIVLLIVTIVPATLVSAVGTTNLVIHGSTTLGPTMVQVATPFNNDHPSGVTIDTANIQQNSSGAGIADLIAGTCDVAMASRALKTSGVESTSGLVQTAVERDAVQIMVTADTTPTDITQITKQQIRGIYEGVYADSLGNTYWNAGPVTVPSAGLPGNDLAGDTTTKYEGGASYPALPGYNASDSSHDHVLINVMARDLDSGTRGFVGESLINGGAVFSKASTIITGHPDASNYPLEQAYLGDNTSAHREAGSGAMQTAINNATNSTLGYAGLGYGPDATHTNIRILKLLNDSDGLYYYPYTGTYPNFNYYNIYTGHYTFARFCYLVKKTDFNATNAQILIDYMTTLDGSGQDAASAKNELRLVADTDVDHNGQVDIYDLTIAGGASVYNHAVGTTPHVRSDVNRNGNVDIYDLTALGVWYGALIIQP